MFGHCKTFVCAVFVVKITVNPTIVRAYPNMFNMCHLRIQILIIYPKYIVFAQILHFVNTVL